MCTGHHSTTRSGWNRLWSTATLIALLLFSTLYAPMAQADEPDSPSFEEPIETNPAGPAAPAVAGPGTGCDTFAGAPKKVGSSVQAFGHMRCESLGRYWYMKLITTIHRHRWYGWRPLVTLDSGWRRIPPIITLRPAWGCHGSGTYRYKTTSTGYIKNVLSGVVFRKHVTSEERRISC
jgi:hypothetical protein